MPESFANPSSRWAMMALIVATAIWLGYAGVKHEWAAYYGASTNPDNWLRAAEIEPANADNWYRLGRYSQLDFDHNDLPLAISYFRRAAQIDPRSPFYKLDLATALETSGNNTEAEKYFRQAQEEYPISAEVSWRYGNFLLRQQKLPDAYAELHRAVLVDPQLIPAAISRTWHSNPDVNVLIDQVLQNVHDGAGQALDFLVQEKEGPAALATWGRVLAEETPIDLKRSFPLIDMLVAQERFEEAGSVWHQALAATGMQASAPSDGSIVFDGGFETDTSGGGFSWRQEDVAGADFDFDTGEKHSGMRSARVIFDGTQNLSYDKLWQEVLVEPNTQYHFRGFLRTDQISTDSGMRFEIRDPHRSQDVDVLTPNETGIVPWTMEDADFRTGPQTRMVQIVLRRLPSMRLGNKLSGTVWVDDVAIIPAGNPR